MCTHCRPGWTDWRQGAGDPGTQRAPGVAPGPAGLDRHTKESPTVWASSFAAGPNSVTTTISKAKAIYQFCPEASSMCSPTQLLCQPCSLLSVATWGRPRSSKAKAKEQFQGQGDGLEQLHLPC